MFSSLDPSLNPSEAGRKGAIQFWKRFQEDETFRQSIIIRWKNQRHNHEDLVRAARAGGYALWKKYRSKPDFKVYLDAKLAASRSRGGSHSLKNLGEYGFKRRLDKAHKYSYVTNKGIKVRSPEELKLANALEEASICYEFEPRFVVGDHAFYPDFRIANKNKIIEVAGYAGDRYWGALAKKIKLLRLSNPALEIFVITSYYSIVSRYLAGDPKVMIFRWRDLEHMLSACRE